MSRTAPAHHVDVPAAAGVELSDEIWEVCIGQAIPVEPDSIALTTAAGDTDTVPDGVRAAPAAEPTDTESRV